MKISKGDLVTYVFLVVVAIIQATEPLRKEAAMPPEEHPILTSQLWQYIPLILLGFVFIIWLYNQITYRSKRASEATGANKLPATDQIAQQPAIIAPIDPALVTFRLDVRKFVLSPLAETMDRYLVLMHDMINSALVDGKNIEISYFAERVLNVSIKKDFNSLQDFIKYALMLSNETAIENALLLFLRAYSEAQDYVTRYATGTHGNPNAGGNLREWLEADKAALSGLRDLRSSPLARQLQASANHRFMAMEKPSFQAWLKEIVVSQTRTAPEGVAIPEEPFR